MTNLWGISYNHNIDLKIYDQDLLLTPMRKTREKILQILLEKPGSTINELAELVGINGISVRHHLNALEADNIVTSAEERHGVGRPRLVYSLTDEGVEQFPSNYVRLTKRLITAIKNTFSEDEVKKIFAAMGESLAEDYQDQFEGKPIEKKLTLLKNILTREGYSLEWQKQKDHYRIIAYHCPYAKLGNEFPNVCLVDYTLIKAILSYPVSVETCINQGNVNCIFDIKILEKEENDE